MYLALKLELSVDDYLPLSKVENKYLPKTSINQGLLFTKDLFKRYQKTTKMQRLRS